MQKILPFTLKENHLSFFFSGGYRSAVSYFNSTLVLTCGKDSCDYSSDLEGRGFEPMSTSDGRGFYSVSVAKDGSGAAFASGPDGRLAKLVFN